MSRSRTHYLVVLAAAMLPLASCDATPLPTAGEPLFHVKEDEADCGLPDVDCVAELDTPASYAQSKNMKLMGFSARTVPHGTSVFNTDLAFWGRTAYQGT